MILINSFHEENKNHRLVVSGEAKLNSWIEPIGTHYLFGKKMHVELEDESIFRSPEYSAVSVQKKYKLVNYENILCIETPGFVGHFSGVQICNNEPGALSYVDGCSNTNVIPPIRNGDPCLNYLYIPPGTNQSVHLHPSVRIGIITGGKGFAKYFSENKELKIELYEGVKFVLPRMMRHSFITTDSHLSVAVFHPDSAGGPVDEANPMRLRTLFN